MNINGIIIFIVVKNVTTPVTIYYCPAEITSNISWPTTAAGETVSIACPIPAKGTSMKLNTII